MTNLHRSLVFDIKEEIADPGVLQEPSIWYWKDYASIGKSAYISKITKA